MEKKISGIKFDNYCVEREISREKSQDLKSEMKRTRLSFYDIVGFAVNLDVRNYRDDKVRDSLHLKDLSNVENREEDFVVELEKYNPRSRPLSHLFIDFPTWCIRSDADFIESILNTLEVNFGARNWLKTR
ncbi:MAG: hypothetical protein BRC26_03930 [Nanohaloarchaea archaeon QH_8_44_6]|nr:MAG: hypothetical protein BRC26_03930 [Nanohaloarchaea archaeon QH_8_44_6]